MKSNACSLPKQVSLVPKDQLYLKSLRSDYQLQKPYGIEVSMLTDPTILTKQAETYITKNIYSKKTIYKT